MGNVEIVNEKALSLSEAKQALEKIEKRDKTLSTRAQKSQEYLNKFATKPAETKALKTKLNNLNIARLKPKHISKIIDIKPKDIDSLRMILTGENVTLKQEDLNKILECLK